MFRALSLAVCLTLSACGGLPRETRAALEDFDPLTADPTGVEIELTRESTLPIETTARLTLGATGPAGAPPLTGAFDLERVPGTAEQGLVSERFRIAEEDLLRFVQLRREIATRERKAPDAVTGSLAVSAGACLTGAAPSGPWPVSVALRLEKGEPFLPLFENVDLRDLPAEAGQPADVGPCT